MFPDLFPIDREPTAAQVALGAAFEEGPRGYATTSLSLGKVALGTHECDTRSEAEQM